MHFPRQRWRLVLMAALTALAVSVTFTASAFAGEQGESGSWSEEYVGNQQLEVRGHMAEARNGGELVQVWRGQNNNNVWLSIENGQPFTLGTTATYVSPTIVPWGSNNFIVIHTGTDGHIYYTNLWVNGDGSPGWDGSWIQVPNQTTNMAVSATQMGAGSSNIMMLYHGANNNNVYSTMYLGNTDGSISWQPAQWVSGGTSFAAPGVTYNSVSGTVFAVIRGEDNQVWMNSIVNGQWGSWTGQGFYTYAPPQIGVNAATGHMLVSAVGAGTNVPSYRAYDQNGNYPGAWSQDITNWQTIYAVGLSYVAGALYAIFTGQNGYVYWKRAYNG
jgi:hypothetical protein